MTKGRTKQKEPIESTRREPLPDYGLQEDHGLQHQTTKQPQVKVVEHSDSYELPKDINNGVALPKTFFNVEGELDLSKQTGPTAVRYLNALGMNIPTILR